MVVMMDRTGQDRTKLTFKLDFPGSLRLAAFAILAMFFFLATFCCLFVKNLYLGLCELMKVGFKDVGHFFNILKAFQDNLLRCETNCTLHLGHWKLGRKEQKVPFSLLIFKICCILAK